MEKKKKNLHFTILNYTLDYTLYYKLFECTFCTLSYGSCYTLHHNVKFAVNLDGNINLRMQTVIKNIV